MKKKKKWIRAFIFFVPRHNNRLPVLSIKCRVIALSNFPSFATKFWGRMDFWAEIIQFVLHSKAWCCLSKGFPGLNSDLHAVTHSKICVWCY